MNYIFFGTPEFAAIILKKLINAGLLPKIVVCNPDRPVGRKKNITAPPVKLLIRDSEQQINIKIFQPEKRQLLDLVPEIKKMDFAIVAAYAQILPQEIITAPKFGTIGVHPSLLPKYRGASPIQSAILSGDQETGVTLYKMDEKVDHGSIISNRKSQIANLNYLELEKKLSKIAAELIIETIPKFLQGEIKPQPQNESQATYTKKFTTQDGFIDEKILLQAQDGTNLKSALEIKHKVRALNPEPGVWTLQNNKRIKLLEVEIINGKLRLNLIQKDGEKPKKVL